MFFLNEISHKITLTAIYELDSLFCFAFYKTLSNTNPPSDKKSSSSTFFQSAAGSVNGEATFYVLGFHLHYVRTGSSFDTDLKRA